MDLLVKNTNKGYGRATGLPVKNTNKGYGLVGEKHQQGLKNESVAEKIAPIGVGYLVATKSGKTAEES